MTKRGDFRFIVKESVDGTPWIAAEPAGELLAIIPGQLGLELLELLTIVAGFPAAYAKIRSPTSNE